MKTAKEIEEVVAKILIDAGITDSRVELYGKDWDGCSNPFITISVSANTTPRIQEITECRVKLALLTSKYGMSNCFDKDFIDHGQTCEMIFYARFSMEDMK